MEPVDLRALIGAFCSAVDKMDAMLGSYSAQAEPRRVMVVEEEFPSGMLARAQYVVKSRVTDFDGGLFAGEESPLFYSVRREVIDATRRTEWEWLFKIGKDW
jgi:Rho GDP-dissociation inhibitor